MGLTPGHIRGAVRQLAALIVEALKRLGGAMSGGGGFPPVGIM